jgi:glycosyltransferase involved in cell wall biosynthesis
MPSPTVSVVLPCYNAHRYLGRALESVRTQTFRDFEIIIVDDGSTDPETKAFLDGLGTDVRVVRQENRGLAGARNAGFRAARGDYVLPLDCDDWIDPTLLAKGVAILSARPDIAYVFPHFALEGDKTGVLEKDFNAFEQLFLNQLPYCLLMRRRVWESLGGYDETMRAGYEDWEFNIRAAAHGQYGLVIPEPLFHYRMSSGGMLQSISRRQHGKLWRAIQARNAGAYRPASLFRTWRAWRGRPSSWNLLLLPWLLVLNRLLPARLFDALFARLFWLSASERAQSAAGRTMVGRAASGDPREGVGP